MAPRKALLRTSPKLSRCRHGRRRAPVSLLVLLCKTGAKYFGTEAKILSQSLKAGQIIWTLKVKSTNYFARRCLNPFKQVKSFGHSCNKLCSILSNSSLNPLKQVKSFGRVYKTLRRFSIMMS